MREELREARVVVPSHKGSAGLCGSGIIQVFRQLKYKDSKFKRSVVYRVSLRPCRHEMLSQHQK